MSFWMTAIVMVATTTILERVANEILAKETVAEAKLTTVSMENMMMNLLPEYTAETKKAK